MRSLLLFVVLAAPVLSHAQVADHLECYAIKDSLRESGANPVRTYTADLNGIRAEPGCVIKMPAKQVCVATTKTNVQPTPPGADAGVYAGRFLCYKIKCTKTALPTFPLADQFGARAVTARGAKFICAPATPPASSTTMASSTTVTTTSSCPPPTGAQYCGGVEGPPCGFGSIGACNVPLGPSLGRCPAGTTCTATDGSSEPTSACACVGDEIPCGDSRLSGSTCNFCKWGTGCPAGMKCGGVPKNGACGYDCVCVPE